MPAQSRVAQYAGLGEKSPKDLLLALVRPVSFEGKAGVQVLGRLMNSRRPTSADNSARCIPDDGKKFYVVELGLGEEGQEIVSVRLDIGPVHLGI